MVGNRHSGPGPSDSNRKFIPLPVVRKLHDTFDTAVSPGASTALQPDGARRQVHLVEYDNKRLAMTPKPPVDIRQDFAASIHVGERSHDEHFAMLEVAVLPEQRPAQRFTEPFRQRFGNKKPGIVPGFPVSRSWISEAKHGISHWLQASVLLGLFLFAFRGLFFSSFCSRFLFFLAFSRLFFGLRRGNERNNLIFVGENLDPIRGRQIANMN